jgi:hypothetical protein
MSEEKLLFFDYFSHNLRNYLIKTRKLAVILLFKNAKHPIVGSFNRLYQMLESKKSTYS